MTSKPTIIYLLGRGRSGSTFLERRISEILGATMLGEVRLWPDCYRDDHICGCMEPKPQCSFWANIIETLPNKNSSEAAFRRTVRRHFLLSLLVPRPISNLMFPHVRTEVEDFYRHVFQTSRRQAIVDSSKNPAYALLLDQMEEHDLRLIHVVRHPLGVVYSWKRQRQRSQDVALYRQNKPLLVAALEWNFSNVLSAITKMRSRNTAFTIRYEDLDEVKTNTLLAELKLSTEQENATVSDLNHAMSGNPGDAAKSLAFRADEEWKSGLRAWEKLIYGAMTYPIYLMIRPTK